MSVPMIADMDKDRWGTAPTGFILTPQVFITVRYAHVDLFDVVTADLAHQADLTPALAFVCCWKGRWTGRPISSNMPPMRWVRCRRRSSLTI
jgi:hypothetical protein